MNTNPNQESQKLVIGRVPNSVKLVIGRVPNSVKYDMAIPNKGDIITVYYAPKEGENCNASSKTVDRMLLTRKRDGVNKVKCPVLF